MGNLEAGVAGLEAVAECRHREHHPRIGRRAGVDDRMAGKYRRIKPVHPHAHLPDLRIADRCQVARTAADQRIKGHVFVMQGLAPGSQLPLRLRLFQQFIPGVIPRCGSIGAGAVTVVRRDVEGLESLRGRRGGGDVEIVEVVIPADHLRILPEHFPRRGIERRPGRLRGRPGSGDREGQEKGQCAGCQVFHSLCKRWLARARRSWHQARSAGHS